MLKIAVIFSLTLNWSFAIQAQDSLVSRGIHNIDTISRYKNRQLDSLQRGFRHHTDSLQKAYSSPLRKMHRDIGKLNHQKDSLSRLNLPTTSITRKIDSTERAQEKKLGELNTLVEKTKKETLAKVSSLHLPPQAQNEVNTFTKNIHGFSVPNNFFRLPGNFRMPGMSSPGLSSNLAIPTASIPAMQKFNIGAPTLPSLSQMEGPLLNDVKKLQAVKSQVNAKAVEQDIMKAAAQNKEINSVVQEQTKIKGMEKQLNAVKKPARPDSLVMQQLTPAVNHFAGKEKELQSAMGQISKYKQKYSSVKSLAELPKRPPNPLKDKPWIERIVPGLNYFIQSRHYTLVDFNPYIGWRFNPRITGSIGWNERVGIAHGHFRTQRYDRVYGVRGSVSYLWQHGIVFRLSPEVMNAFIPTGATLDSKREAWVFGVYGGVRKDFKIYKGFSGYSEAVYNFTQKSGRNIYGDPVSFRLGIEVRLKKGKKSAQAK